MLLPRCTVPIILLLLLSACATAPPTFNTAGVNRALTPQGIAASPQPAIGSSVQWGGIIQGITNLKDSSEVEVLAYPLDVNARPQSVSDPLGRFILRQAGYLEPGSYSRGRQLTVVGTVTGTRAGQVNESDYNYPLIDARQLHLWPPGGWDSGGGTGVGGYFGIGVGSGGSWGSGVGIGF